MISNRFDIDKSQWRKVRLGDIADDINERVDNPSESEFDRFVGLEHFVSGELKIKSWSTTEDLVSAAKKFQQGDILFARRNAYLRRASMVDFDGVCSGDAFVLREKDDLIIPRFLAFVVNSNRLWDYANANAAGTMSKRVKWRDLANYEFLLPPKEQQAKLAELLWGIDEYKESLNTFLQSFIEVRNGLSELLIYNGTRKDVILKDTSIGAIPHHWNCERIETVIDFVSGMVDPKEEPYASMIQIGPEHVEQKTGRILELKSARELNLESSKYLFDEDHVVYSKIRPYLMKVTVPNFEGLCSADMYALKSKNNRIDKYYLKAYLLSERFTTNALKFQNRTGMPKINREELGSIYMPIPPEEEQVEIVQKLSQLDATQERALNTIKTTKGLQNSCINQIFS